MRNINIFFEKKPLKMICLGFSSGLPILLVFSTLSVWLVKAGIIFDNNGKDLEMSILDGNCKLQWKVDWAMRWYALDVDFEMYGKDLIESAILSSKIIKLIGKTNPSGFAYELFPYSPIT